MIVCENGVHIVETEEEMPFHLVGCKDIYMDAETKSGSPKLKSVNPYHNCWLAGLCVTADDCKTAYYIPVGHYSGRNIALDVVVKFTDALLKNCERWINHNIKYDAHVIDLCLGVNYEHVDLVDTVTLAKVIDSDRKHKGGYSLAALAKSWLREDILKYEHKLEPYKVNNMDYGSIPIDILGEYGGQDVITNRRLFAYQCAVLPDQCKAVAATEVELTRVLFDMERNGVKVDPTQLKITQLKTMYRLSVIDEALAKAVGRPIAANTSDDCYDVLCNQYGLPVLEFTEKTSKGGGGNPSFSKHVLKNYLVVPGAPLGIVKLMLEYRKLSTFNSLFLNSFLKYEINGRIHCNYNQSVATGRMSCKAPNFQQADASAKELVVADEGESLLDLDYCQIEFRTIVHYIQNQRCLQAYKDDPDTDFHTWVKNMVGIHRRPAKTVNFLMGYGGGRDLLVQQLMTISELVEPIKQKLDNLVLKGDIPDSAVKRLFTLAAKERGEAVYDKYHDTLPELKPTSYQASQAARNRGYVFNLAGRHRHLPKSHAHLAFNSINQSTAADIQKERTVAVYKYCKANGIKPLASVHDSTLLSVKTDGADFSTMADIAAIMENPRVRLDVPLRASGGYSANNWLEASKTDSTVPVKEIEVRWEKLKEDYA